VQSGSEPFGLRGITGHVIDCGCDTTVESFVYEGRVNFVLNLSDEVMPLMHGCKGDLSNNY
jgi:hypothetical protein